MKLSLQWLRDYVDIPTDLSVQQLMHDVTMTTVEVESAEVVGDDAVLEIDNKSLTNRPDLWGHYGMAREIAAIYELPLKAAGPDLASLLHGVATDVSLIGRLDPDCRRFTAAKFTGVRAVESPRWLRDRLAIVGQNCFNFWVDLTNYVMLDTGQPLHVYDAATLALPLGTRMGGPGDRTRLLNDEEYDVEGVLTIVDATSIVAAAGLMGGLASSVTSGTTSIVLECASFDALTIRRASRRLNLRTDASSRFEKGLDTQRVDLARARFIALVRQCQPEAVLESVADVCPSPTTQGRVQTSFDYLEQRLGASLDAGTVIGGLERLGFDVDVQGREISVVVPTWRSTGDVSGPHDLLEEVARLRGYDNFTFVPAEVQLVGKATDTRTEFERRLRDLLILSGGMHEIVTYPWSRREFLDAARIDATAAPKLATAPAPDQDTVRPSLIPNLIEAVAQNLGFFPAFRIFEMGRVFPGGDAPGDAPEEVLPVQRRHLAGAFVGTNAAALFSEAKGLIEAISRTAHAEPLRFDASEDPGWADVGGRVAIAGAAGRIGSLGVLTKRARRIAGIKRGEVVLFEIDLEALTPLPSRDNRFDPLSNYPQADVDVSMLFARDTPWSVIAETAAAVGEPVRRVAFVDDYRGKGIANDRKSITLRLYVGVPGRTLTSDEINAAADAVRASLSRTLGAETRTV
jgi:phenylalanyl-tRNA synthetase beta chain